MNNTQDVKRILESLKDNFSLKYVKLETKDIVDFEIEELAKEFRSKRIGTEIRINCKNKRFKIEHIKEPKNVVQKIKNKYKFR